MSGYKIVLAASRTESSEYSRDPWGQMLFATTPQTYAKWVLDLAKLLPSELEADGQAKYVPNGLRVVEAILLREFARDEIAVCYPEQLPQFVGPDTRAVGIHAHNPRGITFAADVYAQLAGPGTEPVNATDFRRLIQHPTLKEHKSHLRVIVGGPGAWQLELTGVQDEWGIDCLVDGEAESVVLSLFQAAVAGVDLPKMVKGRSPKSAAEIPVTQKRSTLGAVEITRGCGRGCQFCSIANRRGQSVPLESILANVRANVSGGADTIMLTTEDLFLYEQGPRFATNIGALERMVRAVTSEPGVQHLAFTHATMAPVVRDPAVIDSLSEIAIAKAPKRHPHSTDSEHRYQSLFIGLETGSTRMFEKYMKGKAYPYRPSQWPDVVLKGMDILNRRNWFPFCTWIIGLPGETDADTKESLDLLHALKDAKWCVVPTLFTPLEDTRLRNGTSAKLPRLTELQWEFFFTCWRYNLDFFRPQRRKTFALATPIYYYLLGRRHFGKMMKYPLLRLGHFPESMLHRRLYLDLRKASTRYEVPDHIPELLGGAPGRRENYVAIE